MLLQKQNFLPLFPKVDVFEFNQVHIIDIENLIGYKPKRKGNRKFHYIEKVNEKLDSYIKNNENNKTVYIIGLSKDLAATSTYKYKSNNFRNIFTISSSGVSGADHVLIQYLNKNFLSQKKYKGEIYIASGDGVFKHILLKLNGLKQITNLVLSENCSFNKQLLELCKKCIFLGNFNSKEEKIVKFIKLYIHSALGIFSKEGVFSEELKYELVKNIAITETSNFDPGQKIVEISVDKTGTHKFYNNQNPVEKSLSISIELENTKYLELIIELRDSLEQALNKVFEEYITIDFISDRQSEFYEQ